MNRKILIQTAAPGVVVGILLLAACLVSAWHINHLQVNLDSIRLQNVASLQAAQELEISLHRLRFLGYLQQLQPKPDRLEAIKAEELLFENWLDRARDAANISEEWVNIDTIDRLYKRYREEFDTLPLRSPLNLSAEDIGLLAAEHPIERLLQPCQDLYRINEQMMENTSLESTQASQKMRRVLLFLGLGGPVSGLFMGFAIARGLSRSIYRLSVRIQDVVQRLEQDVTSVSVTADGDVHGLERQLQNVVTHVEEVLERLRKQQQEVLRAQQLNAVGQLAASVAHEVRNPLTSIMMLVEAALRSERPKPLTSQTLHVIHGELIRLQHTVQAFLDFARPPALQPTAVDLHGVVEHAVELVRARALQQRVTLKVSGASDPIVAMIDRGQIEIVLVNLLLNALDAMPDGGHLVVGLERNAQSSVCLSVTDSGKGIAPEILDRLFIPFVSNKPTGTGLGLSISRRIIEQHGGCMTAANQPQGGARFTITLPGIILEGNHAHAPGD